VRILYFTRDYTPHDHRFLSTIAGSGNEVFSVRLERRGVQREDRPLPQAVTQVPWRGGQREARLVDGLALWWDLKRVIRQVRPDLIHAGPLQTTGLLAALSGFRPLVSMSWGSDLLKDADRGPRWRWATRFTLDHTQVLIGDCQAVREKALSFGFPSERVVLFPWGVDLARFAPGEESGLRERWGWQDCFVMLCNRAWEPLYGVDEVVRAFVLAVRRCSNLRLVLLGNGSQAGLLRQILAQAGVMDFVHFGGQVSQVDLSRYYRAADLYLSASHSDGSSVSLMEALACGRPVLVSDIPGNREWILTDGQNQPGWLFPDGDVQALAEGMLRAAELGSDQLKAIGAGSRLLAEQRADWNKNSRELMRAYDLALGIYHD